MDIDEFGDEEWQDIFDELRVLVQRAGYSGWDLQTAQYLDEGLDLEERSIAPRGKATASAHLQLRRYTEELMRFLKSRSRWTLDERRRSLGNLLQTVDGQPVEDFKVVVGDHERSLYERTDEIDAMIEMLNRFHAEISGESTDFWYDESDKPDDQEGDR